MLNNLQTDYNLTRHQLTAAQCAQREVGILQTRRDQHRRTMRLVMDEEARVDFRSHQQYALTDERKRDNERRVLVAVEKCLISHSSYSEGDYCPPSLSEGPQTCTFSAVKGRRPARILLFHSVKGRRPALSLQWRAEGLHSFHCFTQ